MIYFKKPTIIINVILPMFLAVIFLYAYQKNLRKAAEIGLGKGTSIYTPSVNNYPIHITNISLTDSLKKGWELNGKKDLSLWFGNSQLHGVNQYKDGQQNCIRFCFDSLQVVNRTVLGISYPNANMQELLLSVLFFSDQFKTVKNIVIPVFYDDMREDGIRSEIATNQMQTFLQHHDLKQYFSNIPSILSLSVPATIIKDDGDMKALNETAQETTEKYLDARMQNSWSIWANRPDIRGNIFNDLYILRNTSLGIKANTVRKMIPGRFADNYHALQNILKYGKEKKIHILLYIPPLRNDVSPPYNIQEYEAFKEKVSKDANESGAQFLNLENLVPAKWWGAKASTSFGQSEEVDFMHFKETGHRLIADTISKQLINQQ